MKAIGAEKIEFETPDGATGKSSEKSSIKSDGKNVTKTTIKTFWMKNGSKKDVEKSISRPIEN